MKAFHKDHNDKKTILLWNDKKLVDDNLIFLFEALHQSVLDENELNKIHQFINNINTWINTTSTSTNIQN